MFDHWLIMQLIAITRCQKSAKNPMQKLPKNLLKIWHSQKSFMSDILSRQFYGQKSFTN